MLWPLLLFALVVEATSHTQNITHSSDSTEEQATLHTPGTSQRRGKDNPSLLLRPRIHYCRSPNMETFTCWWHFPDNGSHSNDNITFTLTYAVGKGPKRECPDYVTGGANSCYFDSHHTQVWEIYCMNVMANSRHGNYTSEDHCLDVADIVETDPPFNLTYWLTNSSAEETGRTAVVSWLYPNDADVRVGWVTLVFELQYRRKSELHNWKAKAVLREPRLELLELPVGTYEVRVRCKSHNSRLWSKWSDLLAVSIPPHQTIDKMLAVVLVTGIGVMAFLMIGFGVIPQGQRIKAFLLPPVPKPRIRGIDPSLLKNGRMDEITSLFRSFHGYSPPLYRTESWLSVTTDEEQTSKGSPLAKVSEKAGEISPNTQRPIFPEDQRDPSPYCEVPSQATPVESVTWAWPSPGPRNTEPPPVPNLGYTAAPTPAPASDFYACVNGVNTCGTVQLVPCVSAARPRNTRPVLQDEAEAEGRGRLAEHKVKQRASAADASSLNTGAPAGEAGASYTTMDDLRSHSEWCVDAAAVHGDKQEGAVCSEQTHLPAPLPL